MSRFLAFSKASFSSLTIIPFLLCIAFPAFAENRIRTVALSGRSAPGTQGTLASMRFGPTLNDLGQTAFTANVLEASNSYNGIWKETAAGLSLVVIEGDQPPGLPSGQTLSRIGRPILNNLDQVAFIGGERSQFEGFWTQDNTQSPVPVAIQGIQAPETSNGTQFTFLNSSDYGPAFNNVGQVALSATLHNGNEAAGAGIWLGTSGSLALVARTGTQAPDLPEGAVFNNFSAHPPINDAGQTAFLAELQEGLGGTEYFSRSGIWAGGVGSLRLVARGGQPAPGTSKGEQLDGQRYSFRDPALNNAGAVAFVGNLRQGIGNVTETNNEGIWAEGANGLRLVARMGSEAPGAPEGNVFGPFFGDLVFNDARQTAFTGSYLLEEDNPKLYSELVPLTFGLWSEGSGSLDLIATPGASAPGTPAGTNFSSFREIVLNSAGQLAFLGLLRVSDQDSDRGIWAQDTNGNLQLIAREGDRIDVSNGASADLRTIRRLSFQGRTGNGDGYSSGFNDVGELAFSAIFTDGTSGIFVSNLATVPEPTTITLMLTASLLAMMRSHRKIRCQEPFWAFSEKGS